MLVEKKFCKSFSKRYLRERGFGLIEILIAGAIFTFLCLAVASMMVTNFRAAKASEARAGLDNVAITAAASLIDPNICTQANIAIPSFDLAYSGRAALLDPQFSLSVSKLSTSTGNFITSGNSLPGVNGTIVQMTLTKFIYAGLDGSGNPIYVANLNFLLDKGANSIGGQNIVRSMPFKLIANASDTQFTQCQSFGSTGSPGAAGSPVTITGSCGPGKFMTGILNNVVQCGDAIASAPPPSPTVKAGIGCSSDGCITADFGVCTGDGCVTNGSMCRAQGCNACAPGATCAGPGCCGGPQCDACKKAGFSQ